MSYSREVGPDEGTPAQKQLSELADAFAESYLTIEVFAEHLGIPPELAQAMVEEGKLINANLGCLY